jgi:nucleoid DNA-binding protein
MNKKDIVELVARKAHLTKKAAEESIEVFLDELGRVIAKGEKVKLWGFGSFRRRRMKGKSVKVPNKEGLFKVKDHWSAKFSAGKKLTRYLNK